MGLKIALKLTSLVRCLSIGVKNSIEEDMKGNDVGKEKWGEDIHALLCQVDSLNLFTTHAKKNTLNSVV